MKTVIVMPRLGAPGKVIESLEPVEILEEWGNIG